MDSGPGSLPVPIRRMENSLAQGFGVINPLRIRKGKGGKTMTPRTRTLAMLAAAALAWPGVAAARSASESLSSTYVETSKCPSIEEGEDLFTVRCAAPGGGISAILGYWDGRAYVVYEPIDKQGDKARIRDIAPTVPRAFGEKLEWRTRQGKPCAAIIRVYTTKGGILVVNDMTTGKHLGDVRTNDEARALADKACLSGRNVVNDPVAKPAVPSPSSSSTSGTTKIPYEIKEIDDGLVKRIWPDIIKEIKSFEKQYGSGSSNSFAYVATIPIEKDKNLIISQLHYMGWCSFNACPFRIIEGDKKLVDKMVCGEVFDLHYISDDKRSISTCGVITKIKR